MKRIVFCLTAVLLIAVSPLSLYGGEKEQQETALEASQHKEQYESSMEERLRRLGKQLDELRTKAATTSEEARKEMNHYLAEAEKKQRAAMRKLEEMRKKSEKEWKKLSAEMDKAADEFEKAYERAKSHFKN
jgi:TolA-binding protein